MYCVRCGTQIADTAAYCSKCGYQNANVKPVEAVAPAVAPAPVVMPVAPIAPAPEPVAPTPVVAPETPVAPVQEATIAPAAAELVEVVPSVEPETPVAPAQEAVTAPAAAEPVEAAPAPAVAPETTAASPAFVPAAASSTVPGPQPSAPAYGYGPAPSVPGPQPSAPAYGYGPAPSVPGSQPSAPAYGYGPAPDAANAAGGFTGTYGKKSNGKKIAIIAGSAAALLIIIIAIIAIAGSHSKTAKLEQALAGLIDEQNQVIGIEYITAPNLKSQCRNIIKNNKKGTAYPCEINVAFLDLAGIEPFLFDMPEYDINSITKDEYRLLFTDTASKELEKKLKKGKVEYDQKQLLIDVNVNEDGSITAALPQGSAETIQDTALHETNEFYLNLRNSSDDYKCIRIFWALKSYIGDINLGGAILGDLNSSTGIKIESIEKQEDGAYKVILSYPSLKIFEDAVQPGYDEFDSSHKPPYFGSLPANDLNEAFFAGIESVKADYEAEERTIIIPGENDESISDDFFSDILDYDEYSWFIPGDDYTDFMDEFGAAYKDNLKKMEKELNKKFLITKKKTPKTSVLGKRLSGRSVTISSVRENVWFRFFKISSSNVKKKGKLVMSVFIRKGGKLTVNLPNGYYKILEGRGDSWYGKKYGFATSGSYTRWDKVLHVQSNHYYTIKTGITGGNTSGTGVPWNNSSKQ